MKNKEFDALKLFFSVALVLMIGFAGSFFTSSSVDSWYQTINKPSFNPPNWIFGPVWTILYILIGISFYLVWNSNKTEKLKTKTYLIFSIQLFLNFLWSVLFFGKNLIGIAFIEIVLLWLAILFNIIYAYKISKPAGLLLIPYILWVSFATLLNFTIMMLN